MGLFFLMPVFVPPIKPKPEHTHGEQQEVQMGELVFPKLLFRERVQTESRVSKASGFIPLLRAVGTSKVDEENETLETKPKHEVFIYSTICLGKCNTIKRLPAFGSPGY